MVVMLVVNQVTDVRARLVASKTGLLVFNFL
jgi:hypothetical protein